MAAPPDDEIDFIFYLRQAALYAKFGQFPGDNYLLEDGCNLLNEDGSAFLLE